VATEVEGEGVEARRQRGGHGQIGVGVEAGGVGDEHDRVIYTCGSGQLVHGDGDAVGREDA
jgi:hypothetical protein